MGLEYFARGYNLTRQYASYILMSMDDAIAKNTNN